MSKFKYLSILMFITSVILSGCGDKNKPIIEIDKKEEKIHQSREPEVTTTYWTEDEIKKISPQKENYIPVIKEPVGEIAPGFYTWDFWPLLNKYGGLAEVNGYKVLFCLSAPKDKGPEKRHDNSNIRYLISKDGVNWTDKGILFPKEEAIGARQWSSSALWDGKAQRLLFFYSAVGEKTEKEPSLARQEIAMVTAGLKPESSDVAFDDWSEHRIILKPDFYYYDQFEGTDALDIVTAFRDPSFFYDRRTDNSYLVFSARKNAPIQSYNGTIGLAVAKSDDLTQWKLLPPLLVSKNINSELEVPHVINFNEKYYLFLSTQERTFHPDKKSPTGLYAFVADNFTGPYKPVNETGFVFTNSPEKPFQNYSFRVLPNKKVLSFLDYDCGNVDRSMKSTEWHKQHFKGTMAPYLLLDIKDDKVTIDFENLKSVPQPNTVTGSVVNPTNSLNSPKPEAKKVKQ